MNKHFFKKYKIYNIEKIYKPAKSVLLRRRYYKHTYNIPFNNLPYKHFNYNPILNKNCENVVGYVSIPTGIVGPVMVNNRAHFVPIATTEGALVGSINRGARFIQKYSKKGIDAITMDKGITRAPLIDVCHIRNIPILEEFIENNLNEIKTIFHSTSGYINLENITYHYNGSKVHMRFSATTQNAMGMNMISKACEKTMSFILETFPHFKLLSLSGNLCIDKKPSAINWINGRGKTVVVNTQLDIDSFEKYTNIKVDDLVELNIQKNLIGSSLAGSIGGMNAQSSNIVAGIYASTGQDLGQIGSSSVCITDYTIRKKYLNIDLTMPSIEVGTIGGGTGLSSQKQCLSIMGVCNKNKHSSTLLSNIIASTVLCGELSLMTALCKGNLVHSHMKLNRGII